MWYSRHAVVGRPRSTALLLPATVLVGGLLALAFCLVVTISFATKGSNGGIVWTFSAEAYQRLVLVRKLSGDLSLNFTFLIVLWRSFFFAVVTTVICLTFAFPVAYYISRLSPRMKSVILLLIIFPFWSNLLVRTTSWIILLRDNGIVNKLLMWFNFTSEPLHLLYTSGAVIVGLVYVYLPFMILPVYSSIEKMDQNLTEAAADLYASKFQTLLRIIIPLTKPGIIAGSVLVFVPSMGAYITPDLLGGGKSMMLGNLIQLQFTTGKHWPYGAAMSVILVVLSVIALVAASRSRSVRS